MVRNQPGALVPILFGGDLELFRQQLSESAHPPRVVATGLLHEDSAVAHLALDYLTGELGPESLARNEQSAVAESPEVAPRIYDSTNDDSSKVEVVQLEQRINDLLVEVDSVQIERETLAARAEQAGAEVAQLLIEL
jgi:hypothetical protein